MIIENLDKIILDDGKGHNNYELVLVLKRVSDHVALRKIKNPVTIVDKEKVIIDRGDKIPENPRNLIIYKGGFYSGIENEQVIRMAPIKNDVNSYLDMIKEYDLTLKEVKELEAKLEQLAKTQADSSA